MSDSNVLEIKVIGDSTSFSRTMATVDSAIKRATSSSQSFGHATVSSTQAASASLRLLEGNVQNNIRAVERFITTIPGVGTALKAAFPVVGAIALGGVLLKTGEEVVKFVEKINGIPKALQSGFAALTLQAEQSNDELRISNDRLEDQIAKLEHKPTNALKDALDEARLSADQLVGSLTKDNKALEDLFKNSGVGVFSSIASYVTGQHLQVTSPYEAQIKSYNDQLASHAQDLQAALHDGNQGVADNEQASITRIRQQAEHWASEKLGLIDRDHSGDASYAPIASELRGARGLWYSADDRQTLDQQKSDDTEKLKSLQSAQQAAEQARRAGEATVKAWEQQLAQIKSYADTSAYEEGEFWALRAGEAQKGSFAYTEALQKSNEASARLHKEYAESSAKWDTTQDKVSLGLSDDHDQSLIRDYEPAGKASITNTAKWIEAQNQGFEIAQKNSSALAEANVQYDLATNKITSLTAAQLTAMQHSQEYAAAFEKLNQALAYYRSEITSTSEAEMERRRNVADTQNAIAALNGERNIQARTDSSSIYSATQANTIGGILQKMADDWGTMTRQIGSVLTSSIESFNGGLADALTTKTYTAYDYRRNIERALGASAHQAGTSLVRNGLQDAERAVGPAISKIPGVGGFLGSLFGGGKQAQPVTVSNSAANPIWVKSVDALVAGAGGFNLTSLTGGGGGGDSAGAISSLMGVVPFLAGGGDVLANQPVVTGDGGKPELFVPQTAGHVYPDASAIGGSTQHVYVDARGSSDPAAVEATVHRAMRQYLPFSVGASMQAMQDYKARKPLSKSG